MKEAPECYGKMFPSVLTLAQNKEVNGQVFGYRVDHPGIVARGCEIKADRQAWDKCQDCPGFESCYRLSTGTLLMEYTVRSLI